MKTYSIQQNIGLSRYIVNHHDGKKIHNDGSIFYDLQIFNNKKSLKDFIKKLELNGYEVKDENL